MFKQKQSKRLKGQTWGLKKPVIQNALGLPSNSHEKNWLFRSINSVNQNPKVVESQDICNNKENKNKVHNQNPHQLVVTLFKVTTMIDSRWRVFSILVTLWNL